jgi:hypothetical protein
MLSNSALRNQQTGDILIHLDAGLRFSWQSTLLQYNKLTFWGEKKTFDLSEQRYLSAFFKKIPSCQSRSQKLKLIFLTNCSDLIWILSEVLLWNKMVQTVNQNHNDLLSVRSVAFHHYISHHFHFHHLYSMFLVNYYRQIFTYDWW